ALTGTKFITTHHISGIPKHPLHKKADYVIAISQELKRELAEDFNYSKEQIKLIFNGVSSEKFNRHIDKARKLELKKELKIPNNKAIVGFVGSLSHRKGIDVLLEACSYINGDYH